MSPLLNPLAGLGEFNSTSEVTDTTEILQGWCCEVNSISVVSATAAALRAEPGFVVPVQFPTFSHSDGRGVSLAVSKLPASLPSQCGDTGSRQQVVSAKSWRSSSSSESSTASSMLGSTLRKEPLWLRPAAMHATVPIPPAATAPAAAVGVSCCCCLSSSSSSSSVSTSFPTLQPPPMEVNARLGGRELLTHRTRTCVRAAPPQRSQRAQKGSW